MEVRSMVMKIVMLWVCEIEIQAGNKGNIRTQSCVTMEPAGISSTARSRVEGSTWNGRQIV